jgi:uncharacterized protein YqjF (DUF2071 family)
MVENEQGGWFRSDWLNAAFVHLEVDAEALQRITPFEIDRFEGRAYVSLVAFTMRRFRPRFTGSLGAACMAVAARHQLLNVRTYVRHRGERGICFLTEWIPNPLSVLLGPRTYGLPYRRAKLDYRTDELHAGMSVDVQAANDAGRMQFVCESDPCSTPVHAETGSLDEFLLERYTAFTFGGPREKALLFRVWHEPWMQRPATIRIDQCSLLGLTDASLVHARLAGGHLSAGVTDVWIGRPRSC